jgi:hypothetical protein
MLAMLVVHCDKVMKVMNTRQIKLEGENGGMGVSSAKAMESKGRGELKKKYSISATMSSTVPEFQPCKE